MNEIHLFYDTLLNYFNVKNKINIPHLQTGRSSKVELTKAQSDKVKNIYIKDYILLDNFL